MTPENYWIKFGMLRSRVARRMFLLFVGCALLPVGVLALFSFLDVRSHLTNLSEGRLHQASKSAGMTIVERISSLEPDLDLISVNLLSTGIGSLDKSTRTLGDRLARRFRNLAVVAGDNRVVSSLSGGDTVSPRLANDQRSHVRSGGTLVTTAPAANGANAVFIARLLDPAAPDGDMLVGEVNPDYLWGGDGFVSPGQELCVLGQAGETLYATLPDKMLAGRVKASIENHGPSGRFEWTHGSDRYVAGYWTVFMRPTYLASWVLIQSEQRSAVQQPLREFAWTFSLVALCTFWIVTFASLRQIRRRTVPVEQLLEATQKLKAGDFSHRTGIASDDEFAVLGAAFNDMTESMEVHLSVMNTVNSIGVSLSVERDEARLLETVLCGAQAVFNADGAALYLLSNDGRLELALAHVKSLSLWQRGAGAEATLSPYGGSRHDAPAMPAIHEATKRTISTPDVHSATGDDFAALIDFDRRSGYRSRSFLGLPLRNHENAVIGILHLINAQARTTGAIVPFSDADQRLAESLASQAAVALTKNRLVHEFKRLFEGLTELISTAIDEQSPHTGGHVRRVVALSSMIAEAMARSPDRTVRDRALSADELYELRIAALLHDCGKLTTPVHLTDKATKLETIFDRIHLVEARAEIARREHRVELLERAVRQAVPEGNRELLNRIDATTADHDLQLEDDLAVLRTCNVGTEYMSDDLRERIREIGARYRWTNVSHQRESLLSDDEMYHLSVRSGTLTPEEREIICGHVVSTIRMLERLPYPKGLRNVPRYAGSHHEQVSGNGYPLKLAGADIPIQGRIIGIADVLEALTARDRPYRRAMSLSEAMRVLGEMAESGAIDGDLYNLVVSDGIPQRYADEYLQPIPPRE
ncbi:MAG TPA: HD domain-containing phosphohydrolase [Vicinamibacterales bacterium]|jgi:HD-GYP domain-containing protein (c-di-GMP phosphodiesterase class II)/HAMP domain-containing protein